MTVSQKINHINENNYDDDITVTDVPKGYFLAVVSNMIAPGTSTREMTIEIMQLEQAPGGTRTVNSGLYRKQPDETAVQVKVMQDGTQKGSNTTSYS